MASHALLVVGLFIGIILTLAVGMDAHNRGRSGLIWGALTFFTGFLGAFVYVIVLLMATDSDDESDTVLVCSNCSEPNDDGASYCSDCGEALGQEDEAPTSSILMSGDRAYCDNCKTQIDIDADVCSGCGAVL